MVKSLYKIAETYRETLSKTAHGFRDFEFGDEDSPIDTDIRGREADVGPGDISEREDILPEFKEELNESDDDDYLEKAYKRLEESNEDFDRPRRHREATEKSSVIKMAELYVKAEKGTEGAFYEDLEDLPREDEPAELRSLIKDTGYAEPEEELFEGGGEVETKHEDDESSDFGDPGEYMPLTDEEAEQAAADKARRLELIKARHQAFLDKEDEPMHSEEDEDETLEEELAETEADELAEEEELEEESAFEDEE